MTSPWPAAPRAAITRARSAGRRWAQSALLACALAACAADAGAGIAGEHVTVYNAGDAALCAGTVDYLDAAYAAIANEMGIPEAERERIEYSLQPDGETCGDRNGCAAQDGRHVWARTADLTHEIAHALQHQLSSRAALPFFDEGLAVALGGPEALTQTKSSYDAFDRALVAPLGSVDADLAGDFASFLIDTRGFASYERLLLATPRDEEPDAQAALHDVYGVSLDALLEARWEPPRYYPQARLGLPQCSTEPRAWRDESWRASLEVACEAPHTIGPVLRDRSRRAVAYESLEVPEPGMFLVELEGSGDAVQVELANPCAATSIPVASAHLVDVSSRHLAVVPLQAGRHYFAVSSALDAHASVSIGLRRYAAEDAADCPQDALDIDDAADVSVYARTGERAAIRFTPRTPTHAVLKWAGLTNPQLCSGPCDALACDSIATLPFDEESFQVEVELTAEPVLLRYDAVSGLGQGFLRATLEPASRN